jgi:hypothetical protein
VDGQVISQHLHTGDFLIDDRTRNGADRFTGEHILFGSEQFPDWATVMNYLKGAAKKLLWVLFLVGLLVGKTKSAC